MSKSSKGGGFEREVCKQMSLWLNDGESDEALWRTSQSGGRATMRKRAGKQANTQTGDLAGITPRGEALCRHLCFELKTGYGRWSVQDEFDSVQPTKMGRFAHFVEQATKQCPAGKLPVLITRRLGGKSMIWLPTALYRNIHIPRGVPACSSLVLCLAIGRWTGFVLSQFLCWTSSDAFIEAAKHTAASTF